VLRSCQHEKLARGVEHLDLRNAVHIGHSTGGGEATRYAAQHGQHQGRVAKLVLIGAVPPIVVKTPANPGGLVAPNYAAVIESYQKDAGRCESAQVRSHWIVL
jgi:pimeloyl-ACP methyl ester carboxylesterase